MSLNTTPRTWVAAEVLTAANMNTEVRDALTGLQAAWTAYTPTWTGGTNPAIGNGTLAGAWHRAGKLIHYRINLTMGSTTTYGTGSWIFALPVAAHAGYTANMHMGNGLGLDLSAVAFSALTAGWLSSTTIFVLSGAAASLTPTVPWTWASGDKLSILGTYEAA